MSATYSEGSEPSATRCAVAVGLYGGLFAAAWLPVVLIARFTLTLI